MFKITEMTLPNGGAFVTYAAFDSTAGALMTVDVDADYYVYDGTAFTTYDITVHSDDDSTFLVGD
jgi:hypothetical protein